MFIESSDDASSAGGGGGSTRALAFPFPGPRFAGSGDVSEVGSPASAAAALVDPGCSVAVVCGLGSSTSIPLAGVGVFSGSYTRHYSMTDSHSVRAAYEVLTFT